VKGSSSYSAIVFGASILGFNKEFPRVGYGETDDLNAELYGLSRVCGLPMCLLELSSEE